MQQRFLSKSYSSLINERKREREREREREGGVGGVGGVGGLKYSTANFYWISEVLQLVLTRSSSFPAPAHIQLHFSMFISKLSFSVSLITPSLIRGSFAKNVNKTIDVLPDREVARHMC